MTDTMLTIAVNAVQPPVCHACGERTRFEMPEVSKLAYTGRVRVACACGRCGDWHEYDFYSVTFPTAVQLLQRAAADYTMGIGVTGNG